MKNILKILITCFCLISITSCVSENAYEEYAKQVSENVDKVTLTTKIKRDGHTYIVFHSLKDAFGVVHDPDCCDNNYYRSEYE